MQRTALILRITMLKMAKGGPSEHTYVGTTLVECDAVSWPDIGKTSLAQGTRAKWLSVGPISC